MTKRACLVIGAGAGIGGNVAKRFARGGLPRLPTGSSVGPPMASPEPGRMIAFATFHGLIWGMSVQG